MSIYRRTVLYLTRKKARTLIMTALLLVMSCFILIGFSLKKEVDKEMKILRNSLGTGFILKADTDNMTYYEPTQENEHIKVYSGPMVTNEMIHKIQQIDGVEDYNIDSLLTSAWVDLELRPGIWENADKDGYCSEEECEFWTKLASIWAVRDGENQKEFRTGALTISKGRNLRAGDHYKAVISEWLAEKNGLSVGDTLTVYVKEGIQMSDTPLKTIGEPIELEIIGLFHMNFIQGHSESIAESEYIENSIYSDFDTYCALEEIMGAETPLEKHSKVVFFVKDPLKLDEIMGQARKVADTEGLLIEADDTAYQASARSYKQIGIFANVFLGIGIAGLGLILCLLMRLWIQGREHEAGILLSIGIGKGKIIAQMFMENLTISLVAVLVSLAMSGILVNACANLAEEITAPRTEQEPYRVELLTGGGTDVVKTSSDKAELEGSVSMETMLLTIVIVCGVSGVSVILGAVKLTDVKPKRLLQTM